jgi:hypothetical protein
VVRKRSVGRKWSESDPAPHFLVVQASDQGPPLELKMANWWTLPWRDFIVKEVQRTGFREFAIGIG